MIRRALQIDTPNMTEFESFNCDICFGSDAASGTIEGGLKTRNAKPQSQHSLIRTDLRALLANANAKTKTSLSGSPQEQTQPHEKESHVFEEAVARPSSVRPPTQRLSPHLKRLHKKSEEEQLMESELVRTISCLLQIHATTNDREAKQIANTTLAHLTRHREQLESSEQSEWEEIKLLKRIISSDDLFEDSKVCRFCQLNVEQCDRIKTHALQSIIKAKRQRLQTCTETVTALMRDIDEMEVHLTSNIRSMDCVVAKSRSIKAPHRELQHPFT